jgi:hypothetical protein
MPTSSANPKARIILIVVAIISVPIALALLLIYQFISVSVFAVALTIWISALAIWRAVRLVKLMKTGASRSQGNALSSPMNREWLLWQMRLKKLRVGWLILALPVVIWYGVGQRWWLLTVACVAINLLMLYLAVRAIRNLKARLNVFDA